MTQQLFHFLEFHAPSASVFRNDLSLYLKDLKLSVFAILLLCLVDSSSE